MTHTDLPNALKCLAKRGRLLRAQFRYDWSRQAEQAVDALRFLQVRGQRGEQNRPALVAIVGGASSGKSTVFNNLLGGRLASRVTARGHSTRGPIAAVHDIQREAVEHALRDDLLMPSFTHQDTGLDDNTAGDPASLHLVHHHLDHLRGAILFDTPDLTSEMARLEGDLALATLPWFDRLIVLVDHERWFDRQTIGRLRDESAQFGQERFVVFNRGKEGDLPETDRARLRRQADRLGAVDHLVLDYLPGRGCRTFPPGTFDAVLDLVNRPAPPREEAIVGFLGRLATKILNNNTQRRGRLGRLREALDRAAAGAVPTRAECFVALLTADERRNFEVIARVLRITETKDWLARQADRIKSTIRRRVPLLGPLLAAGAEGRDRTPGDQTAQRAPAGDSSEAKDRALIGWEVFESRCRRQLGSIDDAVAGSKFGAEVRRWPSFETPGPGQDQHHLSAPQDSTGAHEGVIEEHRDRVQSAIATLEKALREWTAQVESQCAGASPRLFGAIGAASVAGAILLVAVSGPLWALTLPAIKAALVGALGTLAASAGAGAVGGPALGRLVAVVHEKLLGSTEFEAVQAATDQYREIVARVGRQSADNSFSTAAELVLPEDDDLAAALSAVCDAAEADDGRKSSAER